MRRTADIRMVVHADLSELRDDTAFGELLRDIFVDQVMDPYSVVDVELLGLGSAEQLIDGDEMGTGEAEKRTGWGQERYAFIPGKRPTASLEGGQGRHLERLLRYYKHSEVLAFIAGVFRENGDVDIAAMLDVNASKLQELEGGNDSFGVKTEK